MEMKSPNFQPPEELRDFAGRTIEQLRKLSDTFFVTARKASAGLNGANFPAAASAQEFAGKCLDYAERNMKAGFDHATRLVRAEDFQEVMQLQGDFLKGQFIAMQQQLQEIGAGAQGAASDVSAAAKRKS
jgi:phasin